MAFHELKMPDPRAGVTSKKSQRSDGSRRL